MSRLHPREESLTDEEIGRRERQRTASLRGIVEYTFFPDCNDLLFILAGNLFRYRHAAKQVEKIPVAGGLTDATVSPTGEMLAYIRDQNLHVFDLKYERERFLTSDGGGVIRNGMAEFVAQEEMDRDTGYWWAPDGQRIAFARVDESPVSESQRLQITTDKLEARAQRYPFAGQCNARISVGVCDLISARVAWMNLSENDDFYVARVNWLPDGRTLAIQRQTRNQQRLDLIFAEVVSGAYRVVLTEESDTWIDLNHDLTFLQGSAEFVWNSSRNGFAHLYLYNIDGTLIRQVTRGEWNVDNFRARSIVGIDERRRLVYFMSTAKSPLERQLYSAQLDSGSILQLTQEAGVHNASVPNSATFFVDQFNSESQPSRVGVYNIDGSFRLWLVENALDASHPIAPFLASAARTEFGELTAVDGQILFYRLFKPHDFDSGNRYPGIVEVYGGPGVQRVQRTWAGSSFCEILTRAGFVVMMLDNRGSAHRGTAFQRPIYGKLGEAEVADQRIGAEWLTAQPFIDANRIGVWGWSYGGYMALMLMCKCPHLFRAGVSGAPVTDWRLYDTHYTERFLGMPQENASGYDASSVLPHLEGMGGPLLLLHGMADDNVLFTHSTKLISLLQDLRKPFEVMVYPGAKHGLLRQKDGRHAYSAMLNFFLRTLCEAG